MILKKDKEIKSKDELIDSYKNHLDKQKEENLKLKSII